MECVQSPHRFSNCVAKFYNSISTHHLKGRTTHKTSFILRTAFLHLYSHFKCRKNSSIQAVLIVLKINWFE